MVRTQAEAQLGLKMLKTASKSHVWKRSYRLFCFELTPSPRFWCLHTHTENNRINCFLKMIMFYLSQTHVRGVQRRVSARASDLRNKTRWVPNKILDFWSKNQFLKQKIQFSTPNLDTGSRNADQNTGMKGEYYCYYILTILLKINLEKHQILMILSENFENSQGWVGKF